jgi:hypothetical protein
MGKVERAMAMTVHRAEALHDQPVGSTRDEKQADALARAE